MTGPKHEADAKGRAKKAEIRRPVFLLRDICNVSRSRRVGGTGYPGDHSGNEQHRKAPGQSDQEVICRHGQRRDK
jgi:hypothetical protein